MTKLGQMYIDKDVVSMIEIEGKIGKEQSSMRTEDPSVVALIWARSLLLKCVACVSGVLCEA